MRQLDRAMRPREQSWGDWWNNLNDSVERGFRNVGHSAWRWLTDGQRGPRRLDRAVARPEPIPLSAAQARTWIREGDRRQGSGRNSRAPYRPLSRRLELASRAENFRPGGRRFNAGDDQQFGLMDKVRSIANTVNPVANYKLMRGAGYGRMASGGMVGGALLGDIALTGGKLPLLTLAARRHAQSNQPERDRAEWMRG